MLFCSQGKQSPLIVRRAQKQTANQSKNKPADQQTNKIATNNDMQMFYIVYVYAACSIYAAAKLKNIVVNIIWPHVYAYLQCLQSCSAHHVNCCPISMAWNTCNCQM